MSSRGAAGGATSPKDGKEAEYDNVCRRQAPTKAPPPPHTHGYLSWAGRGYSFPVEGGG